MYSMYETIMDLPLFKGLGTDQLSLMLEKTSLEFLNFEKDEIMAEDKCLVKAIDFILNGEVSRHYKLNNFEIIIEEILGPGVLLGALNLFGKEIYNISEIRAIKKTSVMRIRKEDYINLLQTDRIYLLNYLNYLSAAAQRPKYYNLDINDVTIKSFFERFTLPIVSPLATIVTIIGEDKELAKLCGVSTEKFMIWKNDMIKNGDVEFASDGIIIKRQK